jgi:uncharacterized protein
VRKWLIFNRLRIFILRLFFSMDSLKLLVFGALCIAACSFTSIYVYEKMKDSRSAVYALRLKPNEDLKKQLMAFAQANQLRAAYIITCVGSLQQAHIRYANQPKGTMLEGKFEITSLVGAFNAESGHFHISLADSTGRTVGGHLMDDNLIYTTAEIVIGEAKDLAFYRETDSLTTYKELVVRARK